MKGKKRSKEVKGKMRRKQYPKEKTGNVSLNYPIKYKYH